MARPPHVWPASPECTRGVDARQTDRLSRCDLCAALSSHCLVAKADPTPNCSAILEGPPPLFLAVVSLVVLLSQSPNTRDQGPAMARLLNRFRPHLLAQAVLPLSELSLNRNPNRTPDKGPDSMPLRYVPLTISASKFKSSMFCV